MPRKPGQMKDGMDTLKFDNKPFYAWGKYRTKKFANKEAARMRGNGHNARIIKRKSGYQVYCSSKLGVMGQ